MASFKHHVWHPKLDCGQEYALWGLTCNSLTSNLLILFINTEKMAVPMSINYTKFSLNPSQFSSWTVAEFALLLPKWIWRKLYSFSCYLQTVFTVSIHRYETKRNLPDYYPGVHCIGQGWHKVTCIPILNSGSGEKFRFLEMMITRWPCETLWENSSGYVEPGLFGTARSVTNFGHIHQVARSSYTWCPLFARD